MRLAKREHVLEEAKHFLVFFKPTPIEPTCFIVLVVRIVVAALGLHEFVTHPKYRCSCGEHQQAAEILDLSFAKIQYFSRCIRIAFPTVVTTELRRAIPIVFAVGFIVLGIVRDKIVDRGTIMRRDVVDALEGTYAIAHLTDTWTPVRLAMAVCFIWSSKPIHRSQTQER